MNLNRLILRRFFCKKNFEIWKNGVKFVTNAD